MDFRTPKNKLEEQLYDNGLDKDTDLLFVIFDSQRISESQQEIFNIRNRYILSRLTNDGFSVVGYASSYVNRLNNVCKTDNMLMQRCDAILYISTYDKPAIDSDTLFGKPFILVNEDYCQQLLQ